MGPIMLSFQVYEFVRVALHNLQFKSLILHWSHGATHHFIHRLQY